MTAEVAILNTSAIALAADSAMTFGEVGSEKIYHTNKIFTLSKFHPVSAMIYSSADFMDIPFETIIKLYRAEKWEDSCESVRDYAEDFLSFLSGDRFRAENDIRSNVYRILVSLFDEITSKISDRIFEQGRKGPVGARAFGQIVNKAIREKRDELNNRENLPEFPASRRRGLMVEYDDQFQSAVSGAFEGIDLSQTARNSLRATAGMALTKDFFPAGSTGLVIAGFGTKELCPTMVDFMVDGIVGSHLKRKEIGYVDISRGGTLASIRPFAQREMVARFISGVDPFYDLYVTQFLQMSLNEFGIEIGNLLTTADAAERQNVQRALPGTIQSYLEKFQQESKTFRYDYFTRDVISVVSNMPKAELAHMAEALVNLTSVKRRVSAEKETVGGPIDVAVISKGDGFVWIKRKHYFPSELNQDFPTRYFHTEAQS